MCVCEVYDLEKEGLLEKALSLMDYFDIKDFANFHKYPLEAKKLAFCIVEPKVIEAY